MKSILKLAVMSSTCLLLAGGVVLADQMRKGEGRRGAMRFERLDANKDGSLSQEEFMAASINRFAKTDTNADGIITEEELIERLMRRRVERMAKRILIRMDYNGDGKVTKGEVENRARKRFILLDGNDDGKLDKTEMKRNKFRRAGQRKRHGMMGQRRKNRGQNLGMKDD
jgi:Ca2+-binding EF-hand superfamily protein